MKKNDRTGKAAKKISNNIDPSFTQPRILVIEDDEGIADIFRIILEDAGYITDIISSGVDLLKNKFQVPDLFLIDKNLPGPNGLDICLALKSRADTRHVPVILTSAAPDIAVLASGSKADAYISKPFDLAFLLAVVNQYINK